MSKRFFLDNYGTLKLRWLAVLIVLVVHLLVGGVLQINLISERVEIQQMRADVAKVGCIAAEAAIGLVIEKNRLIKNTKFWAHHWLAGLIVPNGWDNITLIEIPDCQ